MISNDNDSYLYMCEPMTSCYKLSQLFMLHDKLSHASSLRACSIVSVE